MGLQQDIDIWGRFLADANACNPTSWGMRLLNGAYLAEYVGEARDQSTFTHVRSPGGTMPGGAPITRWLSQYVQRYASDEGFDFECLAGGDAPTDAFYTFASNPFAGANNLFFPFFWVSNVADRAATLVHESSHDFSSHVSNSACANGASCDDFYPNANAQTFHAIFSAQSIDAYKKIAGTRELAVANWGDGTCGYIPILPQNTRSEVARGLRTRMMNMFQSSPAQSAWPASATTIVQRRMDGTDEEVFSVDTLNGARWNCDVVCPTADFAEGGSRACDEVRQPMNAARNTANRAACADINADARDGMSQADLAALRDRVITDMQTCLGGYAQSYVDGVCASVRETATTVAQIASGWPELEEAFGYNEEEAIRACQTAFCDGQTRSAWNDDAAAMCFEWDDSAGCLEMACGNLEQIEARSGRSSLEYLAAVVCRQSDIATDGRREERPAGHCEEQFQLCLVGERYLTAWQHQLEAPANGCWMREGKSETGDPLFSSEYDTIGRGDVDAWFTSVGERAVFIQSGCTLARVACESTQNTLYAAASKVLAEQVLLTPTDQPFPGPDPSYGIFDRELLTELIDIGNYYMAGSISKPIASDARLLRIAAIPEATVGLAELVGVGTFVRGGGLAFAEGWFSPRVETLYAGADAIVDPYAVPVGSFGTEIETLGVLSGHLASGDAMTTFTSAITHSDPFAIYGHIAAMLGSHDGMELMSAYEEIVRVGDSAP